LLQNIVIVLFQVCAAVGLRLDAQFGFELFGLQRGKLFLKPGFFLEVQFYLFFDFLDNGVGILERRELRF
jgi:hypothetical protein